MSAKLSNGIYRMDSYYRTEVDMSTSRDACHMVSMLKSCFPFLTVTTKEFDRSRNCVELDNVRNHFGQRIKILYSKYL